MQRKDDHLSLTDFAQVEINQLDDRFIYNALNANNIHFENYVNYGTFLGKKIGPLWISAMTGGTEKGKIINERLAHIAKKFKLGICLGSIRKYFETGDCFDSFNLRPIIGETVPLIANLGIHQIEKIVQKKNYKKLEECLDSLKVDGLMIHINPLQEIFQKEGDTISMDPIFSIQKLISNTNIKIGVKEVGHGLSYNDLRKLLALPISFLEFGAFGGTNFSKLELKRQDNSILCNELMRMAYVGHTAENMLDSVVSIINDNYLKNNSIIVIISGGIKSYLDGYFLTSKFRKLIKNDKLADSLNIFYGQAAGILKYASTSGHELEQYIESQLQGFAIGQRFLDIRL